MSADPYIEFIVNFFDSELGIDFDEEAVRATASLSSDQIELFMSQLSIVDRTRYDSLVIEDIHTQTGGSSIGDVGKKELANRPYSAMFTHPYNGLKPQNIDELKRQILFFNRAAVIVPEVPHTNIVHEKRFGLSRLLRSYLDLKPFVEQGSVTLLPICGFYSNEIEGGAAIIREACESDVSLKKWIACNKQLLTDFESTARRGDPFFDAGIRIASALTYGHRLAATHPFVGRLFDQLFSEHSDRSNLSEVELLRNINHIALPGLGAFDWEDIASIRENDESLAQWREDFGAALASVDPHVSPQQFVDRFNTQVPAMLSQSARALEGKLAKSAPMERFQRGASEITISAVAAAAVLYAQTDSSLSLWEGVLAIAKAEGAKQGIRYLWESRERKSQNALRSHYAIFRTTNT